MANIAAMSAPFTEEQAGPRYGFSTGDFSIPMDDLPSPGHDADYLPGNPARLDEDGYEEEAVGTEETSEVVSQILPGNSAARGLEAAKKQLFSKIPDCAWNVSPVSQSNAAWKLIRKCARVRKERRFIGDTQVCKIYDSPWCWPKWAIRLSQMQTEVLQGKHESRLADPLGVYGELPIEFDEVVKPPRQEYVVLGIFGDDGRLSKK
jgi:hypothetical protein